MIKKRTRPQPRTRDHSAESEEKVVDSDEDQLPIADLIELQKLRKARQGIDAAKLIKGDAKKKLKRPPEEAYGLKEPASAPPPDEDEDGQGIDSKARKVIRGNNFTQQTNALDVDKHMMAYIEENLKVRSRPRDASKAKPADPREELYRITDRVKTEKRPGDEGNVTNSMAMLTAIPEVDLGLDTRLKNIEDTEKAKRLVAEERQERKKPSDEDHLSASRFYRPHLRQKTDADIMRDARLEAMGLPPQEEPPRRPYREMATDEIAMERFKKRMRK